MPSHHTDSCFRLRHAIQDLVENGTLPTPPAKPNVISNSLPQHNQQVNQISLGSTIISPSSTIFNPTDHITSDINPKPVVAAPVDPDVNMLSIGWEMEDKMAEWMELGNDWSERYHLGFPTAPQVDQAWIDQLEAEWEAARADPLDGLSLFMLYYQPEPASPEEDELSEVVRKFHQESDPIDDIVPVEEPRPYVALADDCLVMALDEVPEDLWDVDEIIDLNANLLLADFWDVDKVVDIQMGNEGVPFEEAAAQDPTFWEGLIMEDLETALGQDSSTTVASFDKGKRKMVEIPTDFWDFDDNTTSWIPAAVSVWGLIASSKEHRERLSLALSRLTVPIDITPEAMVALVLPLLSKHSVTFIERDLPIEGIAHNRPLHITVKCKGLWIPAVLIDNGSAINVCPLRVAYRLGIAKKDFKPTNLVVKAYDSTRRVVEGTIMLRLNAEGFKMEVEFHVVDIPATFNLLLGRPWMHRPDIMAVPSTLHQKVMLGLPTGTLTIYGDSGIRPLKEDEPVLGIMHGEEDSDFGGFSFDTSGSVLAIAVADDFIISSAAFEIMRRTAFMPGFGLGINQQGIAEFPIFPFTEGQFGLGYVPPAKRAKNGKGTRKLQTLYGNLDNYFICEGGSNDYAGQVEPFWDPETRTWLPGFEIFAVDT
ncbi:hypothetical protein RHMOL_Rhmol09G0104100 [Rhododendron molle]|uniref:Uncharacterized protein n=1 Tax=Rhododendron molle TaxID=49168 RepID=A0ACC0MCY4_RHOML|nr:hypothetical protein RHMOL_Rhmol09G0104100 [Rhododendron molle]